MNTRIAILVLGLLSAQSHAALQSVHWKVDGDSKVTIDTTTGIEWLDYSETLGKSVNEVVSQLGVGGLYAGWRLPTESEVLGLFNNHFNTSLNGTTLTKFDGINYGQAGVDAYRAGKIMYETMGATRERAQHNESPFSVRSGWSSEARGKYVANDGVTVKFAGDDFYVGNGGMGGYSILGGAGAYSKDYKGDLDMWYGSSSVFLVSDGGLTFSSLANPMLNINNPNAPVNAPVAAVSAPAAFGVAALSLIALFGRIKRRR